MSAPCGPGPAYGTAPGNPEAYSKICPASRPARNANNIAISGRGFRVNFLFVPGYRCPDTGNPEQIPGHGTQTRHHGHRPAACGSQPRRISHGKPASQAKATYLPSNPY